MDSHDSYHQTPPGMNRNMNMNMNMNMMMPPSFNHHISNDNKNVNLISSSGNSISSPGSMPQRFPYGGGDQFSSGDGSLQSGGFLGSGYSLEPAKKKRGRPRKYSPVGDAGNVALGLSPGPNVAVSGVGGGNLESSNDGTTNADVNVDLSVRKHKGRPAGSSKRQLDALGMYIGVVWYLCLC